MSAIKVFPLAEIIGQQHSGAYREKRNHKTSGVNQGFIFVHACSSN